MSQHISAISDSNFDADVLEAKTPVLVDFWAEWCGPCKSIAPMLEEVAAEYKDKVKIVKINVDDNPETPRKYGVRGIPTLMLFQNGEVIQTKVGALSKEQLMALLNTALA